MYHYILGGYLAPKPQNMNILCPNANWTSAIMSEKVTVIRTAAASSARPVYRHPRRWTDGHVLDASVYDTCCTSRNNRIPTTATIIIMDKMQSGWFSELTDLLPGRSFSMEVEQVLHKERSEYQDILVLKTWVSKRCEYSLLYILKPCYSNIIVILVNTYNVWYKITTIIIIIIEYSVYEILNYFFYSSSAAARYQIFPSGEHIGTYL